MRERKPTPHETDAEIAARFGFEPKGAPYSDICPGCGGEGAMAFTFVDIHGDRAKRFFANWCETCRTGPLIWST